MVRSMAILKGGKKAQKSWKILGSEHRTLTAISVDRLSAKKFEEGSCLLAVFYFS